MALFLRAVGAAVHGAVRLHAVADDLAAAVAAGGRKRVDGAFEAVEDVRGAADGDLHGLVVVVAADLTLRHVTAPFPSLACRRAIRRRNAPNAVSRSPQ